MPDSRWDTLQQLFLELLPLDTTARAARLDALTDAGLVTELEALLAAAGQPVTGYTIEIFYP